MDTIFDRNLNYNYPSFSQFLGIRKSVKLIDENGSLRIREKLNFFVIACNCTYRLDTVDQVETYAATERDKCCETAFRGGVCEKWIGRKRSKEMRTGRGAERNDCSLGRSSKVSRNRSRWSRLASYITGCAFLHVRNGRSNGRLVFLTRTNNFHLRPFARWPRSFGRFDLWIRWKIDRFTADFAEGTSSRESLQDLISTKFNYGAV